MISYAELEERFPKILGSISAYDYFPIESLQRFERVLEEIESIWDTADCGRRLHHLVFSTRKNRQGFPPNVLVELMFLKELHEILHPSRDSTIEALFWQPETLVPPKGFRLSSIRPEQTEASGDSAEAGSGQHSEEKIEWPVLKNTEALLERIQDISLGKVFTRRYIGEILLNFGRISKDQLAEVLAERSANPTKVPLGKDLIARKLVSEDDITKALCLQQQIILADPVSIVPSPELLKMIPLAEAEKKGVVPLLLNDRTIYLAVQNPFEFSDSNYFKFLTGKRVELVQSSRELILRAQEMWKQLLEDTRRKPAQLGLDQAGEKAVSEEGEADYIDDSRTMGGGNYTNLELEEDAVDQSDSSVIGLVNRIFSDAERFGASDVHLEIFPRAKSGQIRFRNDGVMEPYADVPRSYYPAVISRIKIMAGIDISEKRRPQDGRISMPLGKRRLDMRVATLPTAGGQEGVVVRLLNQNSSMVIDEIDLNPGTLKEIKHQISKPHGLVLVCGPTGSGKTTTLHSCLRYLNTPHRKIWTAEDPIEITQHNINQVQINPKIDLTFPVVLRALLRADPDVIMIGEMRDAETAKIAVESSMTGHLVLSTLHTNSAAETVARVLDLGVDQYNFSDALRAVLAQRLARRLCGACAETFEADEATMIGLAEEYHFSAHQKPPTFAQRNEILARWRDEYAKDGKFLLRSPKGCDKCMGTGYRGRLGIHELLTFDTPDLVKMVRTRAPAEQMREAGLALGMRTLKQDGIEKVVQGGTTIAEVRIVCI